MGATGSSPRLRGTAFLEHHRGKPCRFIPAPAGNRSKHRLISLDMSVHPRACGEQFFRRIPYPLHFGSSPRLRGTDVSFGPWRAPIRFIPAPAGNRSFWTAILYRWPVHPRACGEQGFVALKPYLIIGSSPRLRGTDQRRRYTIGFFRFIPAPAGNRVMIKFKVISFPVHPRACGEQIA